MMRLCVIAILGLGTFAISAVAGEPCINVKASQPIRLEGKLTRKIFPGPPNYEDVKNGDKPEPAYILRLLKPICVVGDEFIDQNKLIDRVQIFPDYENRENETLRKELRSLIGKVVVVQGNAAFGAHTGHHHAPLLLPITSIMMAPG